MKKLFSFMMILVLVISAAGCKNNKRKSETSSDYTTSDIINTTATEEASSIIIENSSVVSPSKSTSSLNSQDVIINSKNSSPSISSVAVPSTPDTSYKSVICRELEENEWNMVNLVSNSTNAVITLKLPYDWEIASGKIFRNGKQIGQISTKAIAEGSQRYESYSVNKSTIFFKRSIEEFNENGQIKYKRLFRVSKYADGVDIDLFFISVDLTELDNSAATKICGTFSYSDSEKKAPQIKNNSNKFLFLGNSFLSTSAVMEFLEDMLITDGKNYVVESRGGGTVVDFAQDTSLIQEIKDGKFACIFQCGFYYNDAHTISVTDGFKMIIDACNESGTALFAFPAHNEHAVEIDNVLQAYPDIYFINWKNEINMFIESGTETNSLSKEDFCVNDHFKHSTPLAGYVGAHMIYRTLFNKMPPRLSYSAPMSQNEIDILLGNYSLTGAIPGKTAANKYYIS